MAHLARRLFVLSDLHIGGEPQNTTLGHRGFTMFHQGNQMGRFIRNLSGDITAGVQSELVINGDFVDFLAERWHDESPWLPFMSDEHKAAERFNVIVGRNQVVFDSLRHFLAKGGRVTLLLGNHDVELSLPKVRQALLAAVGGDHCNFSFLYDGEAYVAGDALIEHGNRYDQWNVIDHDSLRRTRSAASRREAVDPDMAFQPPAGSQMVSGIMNAVKERYPFVDLLKPEKEAMLLLLLALAPEYKRHLAQVAKHYWSSRSHRTNAAGQPRHQGDIHASSRGPVGRLLASSFPRSEVDQFLSHTFGAELHLDREDEGEAGAHQLSVLGPILFGKSQAPLQERLPALLTALRALRNERDTDQTVESEEYLGPAKQLSGRGFKAVIFGHTHLPKKISLGDCTYVNTGTWADVIEFPYEKLDAPDHIVSEWLASFALSLVSGEYSEFITRRQPYARVDLDESGMLIEVDLANANERSTP